MPTEVTATVMIGPVRAESNHGQSSHGTDRLFAPSHAMVPGGLKHMAWAALSASANGDPREWVVCVTETFTKPTPANERQAHLRLAKRCGLRLVHVTI